MTESLAGISRRGAHGDLHAGADETACLVTLVRDCATRFPDNIAGEFENTTLTYRELDRRADALGTYLRRLGVRADTIVALFVERSPDMVVGVLGIQRAGVRAARGGPFLCTRRRRDDPARPGARTAPRRGAAVLRTPDARVVRRCPHMTVEEMAAHYLREVRSVQPKGPYVVAGYCFGGIVAFEMACQLERLGERVPLLIGFNGGVRPTFGRTEDHPGGSARRRSPKRFLRRGSPVPF